MGTKCFYCEYERAPSEGLHEKCLTCKEHSNFRRKTYMGPIMRAMYESELELEKDILSHFTPADERTAKMIFEDLYKFMYARKNGRSPTELCITLDNYMLIQKKYLDNKKGEQQ